MFVPSDPRLMRLVLGLLICIGLAMTLHLEALDGEPVLDDDAVVLENPVVQGPLNLGAVFSTNIYGGQPGREGAGGYRPVTTLSYRLVPAGDLYLQRWLNIVLHAGATALVFWLALILGSPLWAVTVATLLFAVHPVHVDAVVPLNNRSEMLCAIFLLAGLALWWRARTIGLGIVAVSLGFLAGLSKEQGVLAPLLFAAPLVADWFAGKKGQERTMKENWRPWLVGLSLLGTVVYLGLRMAALDGRFSGLISPSDNPLVDSSFSARLFSAGILVIHTLRLLVWPASLSADYSRGSVELSDGFQGGLSSTDLLGIVGLVLLIGAILFVLRALVVGRRRVMLTSGAALLVYGVSSNVVVCSTILFSERALYLPTAFLGVGLACVLPAVAARITAMRGLVVASMGLVLVLGSVRTAERVADYKDTETLARSSLEATPGSARLHTMLGASMIETDPESAQASFEKALRNDPGSVVALRGLGDLARRARNFLDAARYYAEAFTKSRGGDVQAIIAACEAYLQHQGTLTRDDPTRGEYLQRAENACAMAVRVAPQLAKSHEAYGAVLLNLNKRDEAIHAFRTALKHGSQKIFVYGNLIQLLYGQQKFADADVIMERAIAVYPDNQRLRARRCDLKKALGRTEEAAKICGSGP